MANPENLIPHRVKPGEVKNPTGINQYTYRREAEKHLDEWCKDYGRDLIRKIADDAKAGKAYAAKLMLDRILPAITKVELPDLPALSHRYIPTDQDQEALKNEIKGNGRDRSEPLQ